MICGLIRVTGTLILERDIFKCPHCVRVESLISDISKPGHIKLCLIPLQLNEMYFFMVSLGQPFKQTVHPHW